MDSRLNEIIVRLAAAALPGWGNASVSKLLKTEVIIAAGDSTVLANAIKQIQDRRRIKKPSIQDIEVAWNRANDTLEQCESHGIDIWIPADTSYPTNAKAAEVDSLLFTKGDSAVLGHPQVIALIGSRNPTDWAKSVAFRLGQRCAETDVSVLSGLALGCDTEAHMGCLAGSGKTIAVLAHGLDIVHPRSNSNLAAQIIHQGGCLVSAYPPGIPLRKFQLVARDRLQAELSSSVIVIQTSDNGGSMHAAKHAASLSDRQVGAVLRENLSDEFSGNHLLIKDYDAVPLSDKLSLLAFVGQKYSRSEATKKATLLELD